MAQSRPQNRKRQYAEVELFQDDLPSKKFQSRELHSSNHPPPVFWENLSKVRLTRRALKELDRRNTEYTSNQSPMQPKAKEPRTRSALSKLKAFAADGGPDLSDLRGYSAPPDSLYPTMSGSYSRKRSAASTSTTTESDCSTEITESYNGNFEMKLVDGHVYPAGYQYPGGRVASPLRNLEEVNRILMQPRRSLSPSQFPDEDFRKIQRANTELSNLEVESSLIPILEGKVMAGDLVSGHVSFSKLKCLVGDVLAPGNPDLYHGAHNQQLDRRVRHELSDFIIPSVRVESIIAPNFFLAVRGPDGSPAVAKRQACYDGALGARGMQKLQSYGKGEPVYDKNAYTITSTCCDGTLMMYATHMTPPVGPRRRPEYHMTLCKGFSLSGDPDACRQGLTAFRNARDWAKEKRDQFISDANERAKSMEGESPTPDPI